MEDVVGRLIAEIGQNSSGADGLRLAAVRIADLDGPGGYEEERRLAATLPARRRAEFLAGRAAAHRALAGAGLDDGPVLFEGRRPRPPAAARVSISHSGGVAVALAGPADRYRTLGVDVELGGGPPLAAAHLVLGPAERAGGGLLDTGAPDAAEQLVALFSAKEAAFKALGPLVAPDELPGLRAVVFTPEPGPRARPDGGRCAGGSAWLAAPEARPDVRVRVTVRRLAAGVLSWALPVD
ncbi:4'-phosphopantetheinyl transferase superfamily protein [Kitasatospora sp. NPDC056184]|uniref:4'-phosphopantetheinyl transferase superfamily protein n=1 Tax=Kitasatospora sp. NPDC056184 TaxID=3345738 RepID=UPI0035DBBBDD